MKRRLLTILSAVSLLLFVAVAFLGAISYWRGSLLGWAGKQHTLFMRTEYGVMAIHWHRSDAGGEPGVLRASWPHPVGLSPPSLPEWWRRMGFGYAEGATQGGNMIRQWRVPCWFVALCGGLLPVAWVALYVRQRRWVMRGRCRRCGYDLRATPGRCPECGTTVRIDAQVARKQESSSAATER